MISYRKDSELDKNFWENVKFIMREVFSIDEDCSNLGNKMCLETEIKDT